MLLDTPCYVRTLSNCLNSIGKIVPSSRESILYQEKMAYVTISVIAATFRRAQLHFGNYLESALKALVPLRPLRTYARVNLHARDRQHVHTRALFGRHYAKVQKVTSDPYVGGLKSFRGMPFPRARGNNYCPDGR